MTAETDIKSAHAKMQATTVWTLVLGFAADPLARWSWPAPDQYLTSMPQFVEACGGRAFEHGTAYVTGGGTPRRSGCRPACSKMRWHSTQLWLTPYVRRSAKIWHSFGLE